MCTCSYLPILARQLSKARQHPKLQEDTQKEILLEAPAPSPAKPKPAKKASGKKQVGFIHQCWPVPGSPRRSVLEWGPVNSTQNQTLVPCATLQAATEQPASAEGPKKPQPPSQLELDRMANMARLEARLQELQDAAGEMPPKPQKPRTTRKGRVVRQRAH